MENFTLVHRSWGDCWKHNVKPMWIVHYPNCEKPYYKAYKPAHYITEYELKKRDPWSLDNKSLNKNGFKTMEEAMKAIEMETINV